MAATSTDRTTDLAAGRIDAATTVGTVSLTVSDLARSRTFDERAIGLPATELDDGGLALGVAGERPLIELRGNSSAPRLKPARPRPLPPGDPGPDPASPCASPGPPGRDARPLDGASDHLGERGAVPFGPGRQRDQIYRDRPRAEWRYAGDQLRCRRWRSTSTTSSASCEPCPSSRSRAPVRDRDRPRPPPGRRPARGRGLLPRRARIRRDGPRLPGALFVSAGGYHHHIGLNTWTAPARRQRRAGSVGLRSFAVDLPDERALAAVPLPSPGASLPRSSAEGGAARARPLRQRRRSRGHRRAAV